jgi:hypothetical protein
MKNAGRYVAALVGVAVIGCAQPADSGVPPGGGQGGTAQTGTGGSGSTTTQTTVSAISGSRLKAYWATAADGSQQFMFLWRDTQLNIDCSFGMASDGQYRCLPTAMLAPYFSDSSCTVRVGYDLCATTNHPGYISVSAAAASSCSAASTPTLYVRGAQYSGNVYSGTPSACSDITNILTAFSFYALGSAVDVTTFQSASYNYQ